MLRRPRLLLCALLACAWVSAQAAAAPLPGPDPVAFDRLVTAWDAGDVVTNTPASTQQFLARLHALVPPHDAHRQLRYESVYCYLNFTDGDAGFAYASAGIERARQAGDKRTEANFDYCRGAYREMSSTARDALQDYEAGIRLGRQLEDDRLAADGLTYRGSTLSLLGEQALALRDFLDAQRIYEREGATTLAHANLTSIGTSYRRLGEYAKAAQYLQQSRGYAQAQHDQEWLMGIDMQMGFLASDRGEPAQAVEPLQRALAVARELSDRGSTGAALLALADVDNRLGKHAHALDELAQAKVEFAAVSDHSSTGMLALQTAEALAGLGKHAQAVPEFAVAEANVRRSSNMRYMVELYDERAKNAEALGHTAAALGYLKLKIKADAALARMTQSQYATLMSYQFDSARRDLENRKLAAEKALQDQQLAASERVRQWQWLALMLGSVLLLLLAWQAVRQLRKGRHLNRLALTDELTGVSNRRHIEHLLASAIEHARANAGHLAVIVLDVDHFKRINDRHGHPVGDEVLVRVARACQSALRQSDRLGRTGGEEFMVVLHDTPPEIALQVAERLRANVAAAPLADLSIDTGMTISVGVAHFDPAGDLAEQLVQRADAALYRAKRHGRNRVEADAEATPQPV